jgi:GGDEF domain-containing protein
VVALAAQILARSAEDNAGADGFVGHVGGDEFVAVLPAGAAEAFARQAVAAFDVRVPSLYDPDDAAAGSLHEPGGEGGRPGERRAGLVALSIGIATPADQLAAGPQELLAAAAELRAVAKRDAGSSWATGPR